MIEVKEILAGDISVKESLTGEINNGVKVISPSLIDLEVTPSKEKLTYKHEGSYGYDNVVVNSIPDEYIIPSLQTKEITPTKEMQVVGADEEYDGLDAVVVNAIPDEYIVPSGELEITASGTYDVKEYASANVEVTGGVVPQVGFTVDEWDSSGYATKITIYGMTSLPSNAFSRYSKTSYKSGVMFLDKIKEVVLPNTLQSIGSSAFSNLVLEKINIPSSVTTINGGAFANCSNLLINELSDGIKTIGNNAFSGCSKLALNKLPASLTSLGTGAFRTCTLLAIKTIPDGITILKEWIFGSCVNIAQLSMRNVTSIDYRTFNDCTGLRALWIGSAITGMDEWLFSASTNLQKIYIDLPRATVETFSGYAKAFSEGKLSTDIIVCNDDDGFITKEEFDATTF